LAKARVRVTSASRSADFAPGTPSTRRSPRQEITATVNLYEIPFVPILEEKRKEWSLFKDFLVKERVLNMVRFTDQDHLLELLAKEVIAPAERLIEKRQRRLDEIFGRA
jgi:hypothetical protein